MSRRFRYYTLPPGAVEDDAGPIVVRVETGQDYDTFQSVQGGRWVHDNAAYEYVHGSALAEECDAEEAHRRLSEAFGPEEADRLVRLPPP